MTASVLLPALAVLPAYCLTDCSRRTCRTLHPVPAQRRSPDRYSDSESWYLHSLAPETVPEMQIPVYRRMCRTHSPVPAPRRIPGRYSDSESWYLHSSALETVPARSPGCRMPCRRHSPAPAVRRMPGRHQQCQSRRPLAVQTVLLPVRRMLYKRRSPAPVERHTPDSIRQHLLWNFLKKSP